MYLSKYIKIFPYQKKSCHLLLYSTKKASTILIRESLLRSIEDEDLAPFSQGKAVSIVFYGKGAAP